MEGLTPMTATEERNKPVDGRDVARRLRETGALDGLFEQIDSGEARDDRGPGAAPRSAQGGSGSAACGPS